MALIDDGIAEIALFGFKGNTVGVDEERNERGQYNKRTRTDGMVAGQFGFKHAGGQIGDGGVENAKQQGGTRHAEFGSEQKRK